MKRQDGRFDWLPNIFTSLATTAGDVIFVGDACNQDVTRDVSRKLALVTGGDCSDFDKVSEV